MKLCDVNNASAPLKLLSGIQICCKCGAASNTQSRANGSILLNPCFGLKKAGLFFQTLGKY